VEYVKEKKPNIFIRIGQSFVEGLKNFGNGIVRVIKSIGRGFKTFGKRFVNGSIGTKLSYFIMGAGNFYHKRYVKGLIYLIIQAAFILFMVMSPEVNSTPLGYKALSNLTNLGTDPGSIFTPTDNSMLMMLFGVLTLGMIAIYLYAYVSNTKSAELADQLVKAGKVPQTFYGDLHSLIDERFHLTMLTPSILGITLFTVLPTIFMILIAFTDFDQTKQVGQHLFNWVGFDNFKEIFDGKSEISVRFIPVVTWTLTWAFFATFTCYIGGILIALVINGKNIKLKKMWRTIFMLTIAIPQFISLLAVRQLLSVSGPINTLLINMGLINQGIEFLGNAANGITPKVMVILINMWVGIPFTLLMTSGILMNIPNDLYEAAQIDGANKFQVFFKITLPYVVFITTPYLISSFVGNITSFNIIFLLTGGGPTVPGGFQAGETDLLVTWLYKLTIDQGDYNQGAVISILTFLIIATGTLLTYRRSKSFKEEDTFQ